MKKLIPLVLGAAISLGCFAENGISDKLHYLPDGGSAYTVNGTVKFNRGLYGAHSGFRVDCSDIPEFGIYLPRMGGNLKFTLPAGDCTARYIPGMMVYEQGGIRIEVEVLRSSDAALWKITNTTRSAQEIGVRFGGVADKKFSREGDLGVDPADCFELKDAYCKGNIFNVKGSNVAVEYGNKERKVVNLVIPAKSYTISSLPVYEGTISIKPGATKYVAYFPAEVKPVAEKKLASLFEKAEKERASLASSISISTPDKWINPIGGALSVAADGIWGGQAWLHGSIGWRTPHLGWRGAYAGDALGWTDRARTHFNTYAANQITDIPPIYPHPAQDSTLNLARAEKKWGTQFYSNGYICRRPGKKDEMSHYDMNLVYVDAMLRHFRHTGDTAAMRELFPVVKRHLNWEKRNFDADGDHLYDGYACIWASDALYYNSGQVTHSSAYNMFANKLAAQVAEALGENPAPYLNEAEAIGRAIDSVLWIGDKGHWAEYKETMGNKRLHPSAALWTIYHAIDSEVADNFKNYAATVYVDQEIPHIPVKVAGAPKGLSVISTTDWKPYSWSINNVAIAEVMHTALAYWQAGRNDEAFNLMKGVVIDNMYSGASPLNFGQISQYDAARGECYRDFADPIGVWSRAITEGLYGIRPDLLSKNKKVDIIPGFPSSWDNASVELPKIGYSFVREGKTDVYTITNRYPAGVDIVLTVPALNLSGVTVNGKDAEWKAVENSIGYPRISINAGDLREAVIRISHDGMTASALTGKVRREGPVTFSEYRAGKLSWWVPSVAKPAEKSVVNGFDNIKPENLVALNISESFNDSVSNIFRHEYLSPRPAYTSLELPVQGIGEWCHPKLTAEISDAGLREILKANGDTLVTETGVMFSLPSTGRNIAFTSLWDNFPDSITMPLSGQGSDLYILMAGSTNHMQCNIENAVITVKYTDGTVENVDLISPVNWAPIEQDFFDDDNAFALPAPNALRPYRLHLKSGKMSRNLGDEIGIDAKEVYGRSIPDGAGVVIDVKIDPSKDLESLTLTTVAPDVVVGIMGVTLQK